MSSQFGESILPERLLGVRTGFSILVSGTHLGVVPSEIEAGRAAPPDEPRGALAPWQLPTSAKRNQTGFDQSALGAAVSCRRVRRSPLHPVRGGRGRSTCPRLSCKFQRTSAAERFEQGGALSGSFVRHAPDALEAAGPSVGGRSERDRDGVACCARARQQTPVAADVAADGTHARTH